MQKNFRVTLEKKENQNPVFFWENNYTSGISYNFSRHRKNPRYKIFREFTAPFPTGSKMLDAGCGIAVWGALLENDFRWKTVSIDRALRPLHRVKKRQSNTSPVRVRCGTPPHRKRQCRHCGALGSLRALRKRHREMFERGTPRAPSRGPSLLHCPLPEHTASPARHWASPKNLPQNLAPARNFPVLSVPVLSVPFFPPGTCPGTHHCRLRRADPAPHWHADWFPPFSGTRLQAPAARFPPYPLRPHCRQGPRGECRASLAAKLVRPHALQRGRQTAQYEQHTVTRQQWKPCVSRVVFHLPAPLPDATARGHLGGTPTTKDRCSSTRVPQQSRSLLALSRVHRPLEQAGNPKAAHGQRSGCFPGHIPLCSQEYSSC